MMQPLSQLGSDLERRRERCCGVPGSSARPHCREAVRTAWRASLLQQQIRPDFASFVSRLKPRPTNILAF